MEPRPARSLSKLAAFAWSTGLSLAIFLVLSLPARKTELRLPSPVEPDSSARCPGASVVDPKGCSAWDLGPPRRFPRSFSCHPRGFHDEDWTVTLMLKAKGPRECQYELLVVDSPRVDLTPGSSHYPHVKKSDDAGTTYEVHGKPWRTYAAAPIWHEGTRSRFAGEMILVGFRQEQGSNVRGSALLLFAVQIVVALAIALAIYRRLMRSWTHTGSWVSVALVSAGGGAIAGVLLMLRPPDVGGYDEPLDPASRVLLVTMIAGAIGVTGCFFAWFRELLDRLSAVRRLLLTSFVFPFVALLTFTLQTKWSAVPRFASADPSLSFRTAYYLYFATSVALPLVLFHEPGVHTGEPAELRGRVRRLFGVAAFSSLLAFLVGFTLSEAFEVATPGQIFRGFYKPAGGVGLWIVSLFITGTLSVALVMGTRPRWIQSLNEDLSRFADEPDPSARLRYRQRILTTVFAHVGSLHVYGSHLAFAARQAPRMIRSLLEHPSEMEHFVATLPPPSTPGVTPVQRDQAPQRFLAALERLARIDLKETKTEVPLLLIESPTGGLVQGKLGVACFFDPGVRRGVGVDVCQKGVPLEPENSLRKRVRTLVDLVNDEIVPRLGHDGFDRHRIEVDFRYEQDADLSGASYELPLALALVGLLVENRPFWEAWAATGQVCRDTFQVEVADLEIKCGFLAATGPRRILISTAAAAGTCHTAPNTVSILDVEHRLAFDEVRRDALHALTHDRSVLIGVNTLQQAVEILYGMRIHATKS